MASGVPGAQVLLGKSWNISHSKHVTNTQSHWPPSHTLYRYPAADNTTFCNPTSSGFSFHMSPNHMQQMATGTASCRYICKAVTPEYQSNNLRSY